MIKKIEQSPINTLHAVIILLAMLLAAQMQYIQHGWINPDSILYFESAKLIAVGQWKEALQVWNWPLYPILIATVHKITFLGIQASAQVLNVLFFGLSAFSFIQIIRLAGGKQLTMVAGALILFSSQYIVGDVLEMLMRDEGFWAFYLTSIVFFIRFYQGFKLKDALLWQVSAIIATLFRIEAITYLVLLPTLVLVCMNADLKTRIRYFLTSHSLNLFLALVLVLAIAFHGDLSVKNLGRLQEVFTLNLYEELTRQLFSHAAIMSNDVLGKYLEEFAVQGLLLTFIYVMIVKAISTTGLINFIMAVFTVKNRSALIESKSFQVLTAIALISLMNMALIITKVFVMSSRYVVGLAFVLMILATFQFANILMRSSSHPAKKFQWLAIGLIVFMTLSIVKNIMPKAEGYNYMQDAAAWVKTYNKDNKPVFYDETRVRYYLNEPFSRDAKFNWPAVKSAIENGSIKNYDILMISHSKKRPEQEVLIAEQLPEYSEIKRFNQSKEKKSIVIYRKN
ncbi:MAG: hypothetical protein Q8J66_10320 [Methylotenera sp.]|nr:hypothetical protein [Methylotenera sp.]